jgi:hypothetical protein
MARRSRAIDAEGEWWFAGIAISIIGALAAPRPA